MALHEAKTKGHRRKVQTQHTIIQHRSIESVKPCCCVTYPGNYETAGFTIPASISQGAGII